MTKFVLREAMAYKKQTEVLTIKLFAFYTILTTGLVKMNGDFSNNVSYVLSVSYVQKYEFMRYYFTLTVHPRQK